MQTELDIPKYSIAQAAQASDTLAGTIRTWFKRGERGGLLLGENDLNTPSKGLGRMLTARTVIVIAQMGSLTGFGVDPARAAEAANLFAHEGDDGRNPGYLFPSGETVLVFTKTESRIERIEEDARFWDVFAPASGSDGVLYLHLDELIDRVRVRLGLARDPRLTVSDRPTGYADRPPDSYVTGQLSPKGRRKIITGGK